MELPDLDKPYYTIDDLADSWSNKTGRTITEERVLEHGLDGSLQFHIVECTSDWLKGAEYFSYFGMFDGDEDYMALLKPFKPVPLNRHQLKTVIEHNGRFLLRVNELFELNEGDMLYTSSKYPISKHSLRVSKEEKERFEQVNSKKNKFSSDKYELVEKSTKTFSWRDLFINPPKSSDKFDNVCVGTDDFIQVNTRLPTNHNELFNHLKQFYGGRSRKIIFPSCEMDLTNFRTNYNRWIGKTRSTR
jgi:hypothetical protein